MGADDWAKRRNGDPGIGEQKFLRGPKGHAKDSPAKDAYKAAAKAAFQKSEKTTPKFEDRDKHKAAGEAHLKAAAAAKAAGLNNAQYHLQKAASHAEAAGHRWDDSKHPRDENGRFT